MEIRKIIQDMTLEEKVNLLTGSGNMSTYSVERLGIGTKTFADGPHGVRTEREQGNCTCFPCESSLAATWDVELSKQYGAAIADECIEHGIDMILAPGVNLKRNMLCGRNFEYFSEDPVLAGEMAAAYIGGVQGKGIGTSLKHLAACNQEQGRTNKSMEIDERTLRELYLKPFEIAIKKSQPTSVMCSYNKINAIWCSENRFILTDVLRDEWNFEGFVVSDWGAVQDTRRALCAGLDLAMPHNANMQQIAEAVDNGEIPMEVLDQAVERMLKFILTPKAEKVPYDRAKQHRIAQKIAAEGIVLLKNENHVLPLTGYKKIAVIGEFAKEALIGGQGSAEVYPDKEWIDSPLEELVKAMPEADIKYWELYKKREFSSEMLWPKLGELNQFISDTDVVIFFAGSMESEDTETFERRSALLNPNYDMFIREACDSGKKVVVVLQSGSVITDSDWNRADAVVEMWLGGEGAGKAIADVLTGKVNPSGKLAETFAKRERYDLEYRGDGEKVEYKERAEVGYRYYDKHPDKINYPFGHGLSYTKFEYQNCKVEYVNHEIKITLEVKNVGELDGAEVVQVYVNDPVTTVTKPEKELKAFKKVFVKSGTSEKVEFLIPDSELAYYNVMLRRWLTEPGKYNLLIGSSSQDIRVKESFICDAKVPYTMTRISKDMIG